MMKKGKQIGFAMVLLLSVAKLHLKAQASTYSFTNYTTSSGLPNNYVQSIIKDSRGFMWFGTREGLSRFDGSVFRNFFSGGNNHALKGNAISFLHEYQPGYLLFISAGKLTCLNTFTGTFFTPKDFENKTVYQLFCGATKRYYITRSDSCFIINDRLHIERQLAPPFKNNGSTITAHEIDNDNLLIGNLQEYYLYNFSTGKYKALVKVANVLTDHENLAFQYYDSQNKWLYFSNYYRGLFKYDMNFNLLHVWKPGLFANQLHGANISFVSKKMDSLLWVGTYDSGLNIINTKTNNVQQVINIAGNPVSIAGNTVVYNYTDNEQNEWLATSGGVSKLSGNAAIIKSWRKEFEPANSSSNLLNLAKGRDNNVYVSFYGLPYCYVINSANNVLSLLNKNELPNAWCMNNMGNNIIFTGGGTSFTTYNPVSGTYEKNNFLKKYFPESEVVILAFKQRNGDEWYSGNKGGGFIRISNTDGSVHSYKKMGNRGTFSISYYAYNAEDKNGDVWFGVNKSEKLLHWDHIKDYFREIAFDTVKGITNSFLTGISDLAVDSANNIWIAYEGTGLLQYNPAKNTARQYFLNDGLPTNYISSIQFDGNNRLWIGTARGMSCLLVSNNNFISFTRDDGLEEDLFYERCRLYDSSSNQLWIGAKNTLMRFNPDELLQLRNKKMPVYIDGISINGKTFMPENYMSLNLNPVQNNLQFSFTAVDINDGRDIEYSYRLEGADETWVDAGDVTTASYANLNPGKYKLLVRAKHKGETEWSEMNKPLLFTVQTPWFKTWWFRLVLIGVATCITWLLIRFYYTRKLKEEKLVLEKQQAIEKERTRIATDMHDDFGASLSRIKFISERIQVTNRADENLKNDLVKISSYSDEMAEKMNEIVWALNQRYDTLDDLISFSRAYAADYLLNKNIQLVFKTDTILNKKIHGEVRRNIFMVIKEALHNAVKHAAASVVTIEFKELDKLIISIGDNGKGINLEHIRPFANGIDNMKKRVDSIGGEIQFLAVNGTHITMQVPI